MDVSKNVIDRARRDIGLFAVGFTDTFNIQHAAGDTLNQVAGGDFFSSIAPVTTAIDGEFGHDNRLGGVLTTYTDDRRVLSN